MSAIFGWVDLSGKPIDYEKFSRSFEKVRPYGPDRSEVWMEGAVAVGRHLLHVAPTSKNDRLHGPTDGVLMAADAILDNREEVARALGLSPPQLTDSSDTDLLGQCFRRWGERCPSHLVGDFAFAAIDVRRPAVFLARDHIGTRPLFWSLRNRTLLFSTSIQAIVSCDDWRWRLDDRIVTEYLSRPSFPVSKPFFKHIASVPAGSFLSVTRERICSERWWRPSTVAARRYKSDPDVVSAGCCLLERAVRDRVDTEGAVGAHCSGGIDSTSVAVIAARTLESTGKSLASAYAWSPPVSDAYPADHAKDERARIRQVTELERIPIRFGWADETNFLDFIDRPLELEGEADLADEIPFLMAAKCDRIRVMLSGWGGDEAFSAHGYGYLGTLLSGGKLLRAARFMNVPAGSFLRPKLQLRLLWQEIVRPLLPHPARRLIDLARGRTRAPTFISAAMLREHKDLTGHRGEPIEFEFNPNVNLRIHTTAGHLTMRMETWAAWSAPYGFQYRYPLTDRRLLEFVFTLPPDQLFLNNQPRGLARAVISKYATPFGSKRDIANERLRRDTYDAVWRTLALNVERGKYSEDCPWVDMRAFREHAQTPADLEKGDNIELFNNLFAAARVWALYRRAAERGWL